MDQNGGVISGVGSGMTIRFGGAIGGYSKEEKHIIYFIINHFQINKLRRVVHEIDESAFISLLDVSDVIRKNES